MEMSVVIPTCNRKESLFSVLTWLSESTYPIREVIVVDSSDVKLTLSELPVFNNFKIEYITSKRSVCVQRNIGIRLAKLDWIFLCDDDVEVPSNYLEQLVHHAKANPDAGAISGFFMQKYNDQWTEQYPITSTLDLLWRFIFQLSIWGEIRCNTNNSLIDYVKNYYERKGNHISKAGWPVITEFSKNYFNTPLYSLGASLVKKEWLLCSPFDETLDSHGVGDNYGVALGFPGSIQILKNAFVYHHQEKANRLTGPVQYQRRVLALDYFIRTKKVRTHVKLTWFLWSLTGNLIYFMLKAKRLLVGATLKAMAQIILNKNPYLNRKGIS